MTSTVAASKPAAVSTTARTRPEKPQSWAEGRIEPQARERPAYAGARAETDRAETDRAETDRAETNRADTDPARTDRAASDYFVNRDGQRYAGTHLLIDLWGAERLDDLAHAEATLRAAVRAVGATLLDIRVHHFTPNNGVSGIAVLAESHISIHTWPERGYAALDIFVCGACDPYAAIPVLRQAWRPEEVVISEHRRGLAE